MAGFSGMKNLVYFPIALLLTVASSCPAVSAQTEADTQATLTFVKEFPGSVPDYYSIAIASNGQANYRIAPDEKPTSFQVSAESVSEIFALAEKLDYFREVALESKHKVAAMGTKSFLYQDGIVREEVSYNHTENEDALALTKLFERLAATQQHRDRIEYLLRFDKLGIVKELLQLEIDFDEGRLLEAELLLPALEKVRGNSDLVNVAHQRAAGIIRKIQSDSGTN
jgi:hypothetical protein